MHWLLSSGGDKGITYFFVSSQHTTLFCKRQKIPNHLSPYLLMSIHLPSSLYYPGRPEFQTYSGRRRFLKSLQETLVSRLLRPPIRWGGSKTDRVWIWKKEVVWEDISGTENQVRAQLLQISTNGRENKQKQLKEKQSWIAAYMQDLWRI